MENSMTITPGMWVRCTSPAACSQTLLHGVYKVLEVYEDVPGGPASILKLEGVAFSCVSTAFTPVRPQGPALLFPLLGIKPAKGKQ